MPLSVTIKTHNYKKRFIIKQGTSPYFHTGINDTDMTIPGTSFFII